MIITRITLALAALGCLGVLLWNFTHGVDMGVLHSGGQLTTLVVIGAVSAGALVMSGDYGDCECPDDDELDERIEHLLAKRRSSSSTPNSTYERTETRTAEPEDER